MALISTARSRMATMSTTMSTAMSTKKSIGNSVHVGALALLAGMIAFTVAGCGELNDNPAPEGIIAHVILPGSGSSGAKGLSSPDNSEPIISMVVGALVITYRDTPIKDASEIDAEEQELLEDDAFQSAKYLEVFDLPSGDVVSFRIPPDEAGNWQLVGLGTRVDIDTLAELGDTDDPIIWYGFSTTFLNGEVNPGDEVPLTLGPACSIDNPPVPPC